MKIDQQLISAMTRLEKIYKVKEFEELYEAFPYNTNEEKELISFKDAVKDAVFHLETLSWDNGVSLIELMKYDE